VIQRAFMQLFLWLSGYFFFSTAEHFRGVSRYHELMEGRKEQDHLSPPGHRTDGGTKIPRGLLYYSLSTHIYGYGSGNDFVI
jgi:hypothetical protein